MAGLGGCVTKGDVQQVQDDVALLKAETARRDSARAAQLTQVIQIQQRVMDSLTANRKAASSAPRRSGDRSVQHPAAAGAASGADRPEPAAAERAADPARGAGRADLVHRPPARPTPRRSAASVGLRRSDVRGLTGPAAAGKHVHRAAGPARDAADLSHQRPGWRCAVLHRAELCGREPGFGRRLLCPGGAEISHLQPRRRRPSTTLGSWPSGGRRPRRPGRPISGWFRSIPSPTKRRWRATD